jgi:glutamyl-tRNA reductase
MSVLVVGLSHKSAPLATLERAVLTGDALGKLSRDVFHAESVAGSFVISTCNRAEIYADVDKFHDGVSAICELLARHTGIPPGQLTPHLYVHYEDRAAQHLLAVACGLDSMVIGESQILGQVRQALNVAREQGTLDRALSDLGAVALRAGKRARAETGIDRSGASLASVGLSLAAARLRGVPGPAAAGAPAAVSGTAPAGVPASVPGPGCLAGLSMLVVGAGAMSSIAVAAAARMGAAGIVVANRGHARARRLAATVSATSADLSRLPAEIAAADLVVSCTGAPGAVITADCVAQALSARAAGRPLVLLDLAVPRDVEAGAGLLPGA